MTGQRIPCAGAVVLDRTGRLLLVRRGTEPGRGLWSIPGGRVEPGESSAQAAVREVAEETGLEVLTTRLLGVVERAAPGGAVFDIEDHGAELVDHDATPRPGDDAAEVRWATGSELRELARRGEVVEGLVEALAEWEVLPEG